MINIPAAQLVQVEAPEVALYCPAPQLSQYPPVPYLPSAQAVQVVSPVVALYFPMGQSKHEPGEPYCPAGQAGGGVGGGVGSVQLVAHRLVSVWVIIVAPGFQ